MKVYEIKPHGEDAILCPDRAQALEHIAAIIDECQSFTVKVRFITEEQWNDYDEA